MRVIAGRLGGRLFVAPKGNRTHPMGDKVRGGLFNVLGDVSNLKILDAFSGSGALSFEAASRDARPIVAIDNDKSAQLAIAATIELFRLESTVKLIRTSTTAWLATSHEADFDIVLLDPPYNNMQPRLLARLAARVKVGGIVVMSHPPDYTPLPPSEQLILETEKTYGDAVLSFLRRTT